MTNQPRLADAAEEAEVRQLLHTLGIHATADLLLHIEAAFRDKNAAIEALTVERDALRAAARDLLPWVDSGTDGYYALASLLDNSPSSAGGESDG